jgi:preprotein translocase subunit SecD
MKLSIRVWILIVVLFFSLLVLAPWKSLEDGVMLRSVEKNTSVFDSGLRAGMIIKSINGQEIKNLEEYTSFHLENKDFSGKMIVETKDKEFIFLTEKFPDITVAKIPSSNLKTGLDLSGGARALVKAENMSLTPEQLDDLVSITTERLNAFGLNDVVIKSVTDLSGENYMLIEIAGSTQKELQDLLESQGEFEAKIGEDIVFIGGERDITYVGSTGQDAGIYSCSQVSATEYACEFRFVIYLSEKAAQRQADITSNLSINTSSGGRYLSKPLDLYVDGNLMDTLQIGADLKGSKTTQIQISGSGKGTTQTEAYDDAKLNMKKLQTILKTGSLPYKLEIVKLDTISPTLGKTFTKNLVILALCVFLIISTVLFIKYRKIKLTLAVVLTMFSEAFITLAIATLLKWNLDVSSIAGIIAGMGTGVNDQIVIIDESKSKENSHVNIKERIKKALFIILGAFFTIIAAMIPLFWAGAGMLRGFALTTIIGVSIGILITRPAFADIIGKMEE